MATKSSITNSVVHAASNDTSNNKNEKETTKNVVVVASDDSSPINEQNDKKATGIKNVGNVPNESTPNIVKEDEKQKKIDTSIISLDKLSLGPKKKLLVLPLGGFIVHRAHRRGLNTIPKNRRPDFSFGNFFVYKRPFCEEFLKFCFERFHVGIWSTTSEHNLLGVLNPVMGDLKSQLLFTWDHKQCTNTGFTCLGSKDKPLFLKELDGIWQKKYSNLAWCDGEYSASNTLLVTDPVKALLNPPNTAIFPQNYDPEDNEDDFLGPGGELRMFLDGLAHAKDVPTYVKDHRIGEPAITSSHSDWGYYSKIIRALGKKEMTDHKN
uniref:uncharacterized protein LOC122583677 n=1 Tax=Erigeron canadensis TaxID=72917 RepID=UPI001CB9AFE7|nr:uncharacterized protein LOC122583677 [Erigeron canadensis]